MHRIERLRDVIEWVRKSEHSSLYRDIPSTDALKSIEDLAAFPATRVETLRENAENLRHYPEEEVRFLSSVFDAKELDTLFLIPQRVDEEWDTLACELADVKPRAAFLSIPPFWQVSPFFYYTCRTHNVPVSVGNPRSPNLSLQIIEGVEVEYAMTTSTVMHELREGLVEKGIRDSVQLWHVVSPLGQLPSIPSVGQGVRISVEYHLFPGVPIAYTSPEQYENDAAWAAPNPEYFYEFEGEQCFLTSLKRHAMPLIRFAVPSQVEVQKKGEAFLVRFV